MLEKVRQMVEERGFSSFKCPDPEMAAFWQKKVDGHPCYCNDALYVDVSFYEFRGKYRSVTVEIRGEDATGVWWSLKSYGLGEADLHLFDDVVDRLIAAWNSLHRGALERLSDVADEPAREGE